MQPNQTLAQVSIPMPESPAAAAQKFLAIANSFQVTNAESYALAAGNLKSIKVQYHAIDTQRDEMQKPIRAAAAAVQAFFKPPLETLQRAEIIYKDKLVAFDREQERLRQEEQRRQEEAAARARAEAEAKAREAERIAREQAEAARREAEAQRQAAERARQQAEAAKAAGDAAAALEAARVLQDAVRAAEKLESKADRVEERGAAKVEALVSHAASIVAPVIQRETPKVAGLAGRENWKAECTDLMALVKAVAEGKQPLYLVMANDKVLGQQARSLKDQFKAPGVRVWNDRSFAAARG
jgi:hypothetical protein